MPSPPRQTVPQTVPQTVAQPAAPDDAVSLTVHSMPAADAALQDQRTRQGRWKMMLVLAMCAAPVLASYFTYYVIRPQGRTNYSQLIQPTKPLPASLALRELNGQTVAPDSLRRQWLLLTLGPAACDAACEQRLLVQRQLHQMLGREKDRLEKIWLVVDDGQPAEALLKGVQSGAEGARVLRAPRAELERWLEPAPGQALEDHFYIVDPMGEWMMRSPAKPEAQRLKRDLDKLLRASSFWDSAGR